MTVIGKINIDWAAIHSEGDLYESALAQMAAPSWHGDNLDALNDSWVTGGICASGPPYAFQFHNVSRIDPAMSAFAQSVMELARESVAENGGSVHAA